MNAVSDEQPQYLDGLTFVVSGVFENISRDKIETFILDHGGRRTGSVSGKTDYLVVGYKMEDGREVTQGGKYNGAKKKGIEILNEEKFEELIQKLSGDASFSFGKSRNSLLDAIPEEEEKPKEAKKSIITTTDGEKVEVETEMWTEKYKPKGFRDLIGNNGVIENLYNWLKDWDEVCIRGNKKASNWKGNWADAPNVNARATLISGPPGIGKTSSARIVCA